MGFDPNNNCQGVQVGHRGGGGCFAEDTHILMGDGSLKRAGAIRPGDEVYSPIVDRPIKVRQVIAGPESAALLAISLGDRSVRVTQEHPFMTRLGPVPAHQLKPGDEIIDLGGQYQAITAIQSISHDKPVNVWNFVLDGSYHEMSHLLVGDGIVSGDLVLQQNPVNRNLLRFAFDLD